MKDLDTNLGGANQEFPMTAWSCVLLPQQASPEARQRHLETLARRYWKPIYHYIRARWRYSNEDAKDLTQQFFVWMLHTDFMSKVRSDRGRFRNFVRVSLEHFLSRETRKQHRQKAGQINLDFIQDLPADSATPDQDAETVLNEQWKRAVIQEALERLRQYYAAHGKDVQYLVFRDYYFAAEGGVDYEGLAKKHAITAVDVQNYLARARTRYRGLLEEVVAESVSGYPELKEEYDALFKSPHDRERS